jgi:hypothetical protein
MHILEQTKRSISSSLGIRFVNSELYHIPKGNRQRSVPELDRGTVLRQKGPSPSLVGEATVNHIHQESTSQISARLPPALARGDEPNVPAMNRHIMSIGAFVARAQGIWKIVKTVHEKRYTGRRPRTSDNGAQTSGPNAKPKT